MNADDVTELVDFYKLLLEAERAGVAALNEIIEQTEDPSLKPFLEKFMRDEGVNCRILVSLIRDLGAKPSERTGAFVEKMRALKNLDEKLRLLIRGQQWVARQIREHKGASIIGSAKLFVEAIREQHEENVKALGEYLT